MDKILKLRLMLVVAISFCFTFPAIAQVEMLLMADGIDGGSKLLPGGIDVETYRTGASSTPSTGGAGVGKTTFSDLSLVKDVDKASPKLFEKCATGTYIPTATLYIRKTDVGDKHLDYLIITMKDVLVTSYQTGGSTGGSDLGTETISLNFKEIKFTTIINGGPEVEFGWKIEENAPV